MHRQTAPFAGAQHEAVIERGLQTFYEVGSALMAIRDARLYRAGYATFEAYCQERWGISRPSAYRLIDAAEVIEDLSPIGDISPPATESQARPLATLPRTEWPRLGRGGCHRAGGQGHGGACGARGQRSLARNAGAQRNGGGCAPLLIVTEQHKRQKRTALPGGVLAQTYSATSGIPLYRRGTGPAIVGLPVDLIGSAARRTSMPHKTLPPGIAAPIVIYGDRVQEWLCGARDPSPKHATSQAVKQTNRREQAEPESIGRARSQRAGTRS